ncbi:MAG: serine hydrolase [Pseudomonadota bacterium]|nr:serine hydrolase [Pseudomonadota bacterium]
MRLFHCVVAAALLALSLPVSAQEASSTGEEIAEESALETRAADVVLLFTDEVKAQEIFTPGFIAAIPTEQIEALTQQLTTQFGKAVSVEHLAPVSSTRAALHIRFERAIAIGGIAIDPNDSNRISELRFTSFDPVDDSLERIKTDLEAMPGIVSAWFGPLDMASADISIAAERQMPLGSTFKLYVLATLAREIAQGRRAWMDTITLPEKRSFPSGAMQDWPTKSPVTLHTLATLMISISDNTATDVLIEELGRDLVFQTIVDSGHSQPALNYPVMTTRDFFLLKSGPEERLKAYQNGTPETRAAIIRTIEQVPVSPDAVQATFSGGPVALEVEWFANAADMAALLRFMRETADPAAFDILTVNRNTSSAVAAQWDFIGYKGGSEPGVLNYTWLLRDSQGRDRVLFLSWSNKAANLDEDALNIIAQRILSRTQ